MGRKRMDVTIHHITENMDNNGLQLFSELNVHYNEAGSVNHFGGILTRF